MSTPCRTEKSGSISSIASTSSSDSAPLDNFTGVSSALADISEQEQHGLLGANGDVKAARRPSMEDTEEAIRKYKADLLSYTRKSFDEFKINVEQCSRSNSTPLSPNLTSSKP